MKRLSDELMYISSLLSLTHISRSHFLFPIQQSAKSGPAKASKSGQPEPEPEPPIITAYLATDIGGPAVIDSYSEQEAYCVSQNQRLCKLEELCPTRPIYNLSPFDQAYTPGFTVPADIVGEDSWVAYDTSDTTLEKDKCSPPRSVRDGCNILGGCAGNGWVQIGNWPGNTVGVPDACNSHCELTTACPSWGTANGGGYTPNAVVCCSK